MGDTFKKITYPRAIEKAAPRAAVLGRLRSYLDAKEPRLVYFLVNLWQTQGRAITYKELREAILAGEISADILDDWRQDYARFVKEHLEPRWIHAIDAAAREINAMYPAWNFDPMAEGVQSWVQNRAAEFVTSVTDTQIQGLRSVVMRAAVLEDIGVDQLARAIRPMVGLYHQQGIANLNYYNTLLANGASARKALDLSTRYAARQQRYRGYLIARTELAFAYNQGSYEATKQAQAAGYMGEVVKVWCTADDERMCSTCRGLDGKEIAMEEDFDFQTRITAPNTICRVPPAHPSCRCTVMYEEISPAIIR